MGVELRGESLEKLVTRVQEVLINFKNKVENASQIEKSLAFKKIIQKIQVSKNSLEVIIAIEDTTNDEILKLSGLGSGKAAARIRGEHPNPCAPVCTSKFENQLSVPSRS